MPYRNFDGDDDLARDGDKHVRRGGSVTMTIAAYLELLEFTEQSQHTGVCSDETKLRAQKQPQKLSASRHQTADC
jgi:hypothetical protein